MIKIACIGSRSTPLEVQKDMEELGKFIASSDKIIATGNAKGADQAFARGGNSIDPEKVWLFLPWYSYEKEAIVEGNNLILNHSNFLESIAAEAHPAWKNLSSGVKKLMIRNAGIIYGSKLVIGYLDNSKKGGGGTGHSWRIAKSLNIPCIDLSHPYDKEDIKKFINNLLVIDNDNSE